MPYIRWLKCRRSIGFSIYPIYTDYVTHLYALTRVCATMQFILSKLSTINFVQDVVTTLQNGV